MIAPSGNGSRFSRYALIAISLPKSARISLGTPASWATEINFQSRYPGGILIEEAGSAFSPASPEASPDAGILKATTPTTAATATSKKTTRFIEFSFQYPRPQSSIFETKSNKRNNSVGREYCPTNRTPYSEL